MPNIYQLRKAKVVSVNPQSADTVLLRFKFTERGLQKEFAFVPGQFMQVGIPGWGECPISICSSPYDSSKFFELAVRDVGQLTHKLCNLKPGDEVWMRGPFGNGIDVDKLKGKSVLLVGGGCGFIPLRPLILDHIANRLDCQDLKVFYGCLNEESTLFKDEYPAWNRSSEFAIALEKPSAKWQGAKGYVTELIRNREISKDSIAVLVGPPVMYRPVVKELLVKKLKPENIYLSLERRMHCGLGTCQHCAIGPYYVCKDGPVFTWDQIKDIHGAV